MENHDREMFQEILEELRGLRADIQDSLNFSRRASLQQNCNHLQNVGASAGSTMTCTTCGLVRSR